MSEVWGVEEQRALRVLQAAVIEAYGRPGVYVQREPVMRRANLSDVWEFVAVAEYLDQRGWIGEADADYTVFGVTPEGIETATD